MIYGRCCLTFFSSKYWPTLVSGPMHDCPLRYTIDICDVWWNWQRLWPPFFFSRTQQSASCSVNLYNLFKICSSQRRWKEPWPLFNSGFSFFVVVFYSSFPWFSLNYIPGPAENTTQPFSSPACPVSLKCPVHVVCFNAHTHFVNPRQTTGIWKTIAAFVFFFFPISLILLTLWFWGWIQAVGRGRADEYGTLELYWMCCLKSSPTYSEDLFWAAPISVFVIAANTGSYHLLTWTCHFCIRHVQRMRFERVIHFACGFRKEKR